MVTRFLGRRAGCGVLLSASVILGLGLFSCEKIVGIGDVASGGTGGKGGQGQGGGAGDKSFGGHGGGGEGALVGGNAGILAGRDMGGQAQGGHPETGGATSMSGGHGGAGGGLGGAAVGGAAGIGGAAGAAAGAGGSPVAPLCLPASSSSSGTAFRFTRPAGDNRGLCSYPNGELLPTRSYGAIDQKLWSSANACGRCLEVSNLDDPPVKVEIEIIDVIKIPPEVGDYSLSLEDEARASLNNGKGGNPRVTFKFIPCSNPGDMKVSFPNPVAEAPQVLVMGHRWGLSSVEIKSGSNWLALTRPDYNLWMLSGNGPSMLGNQVSLRITDELGEALVVEKVPFSREVTNVHAQFAMCRDGAPAAPR